MSEPRPPRISPVTYLATFIPGLLVIVAAVLLLWATPRSIEAISHQRTVRQVQEANFRLNEPSIPTQSTTFLEQLNRASRDVATLVRPSVGTSVPRKRSILAIRSRASPPEVDGSGMTRDTC